MRTATFLLAIVFLSCPVFADGFYAGFAPGSSVTVKETSAVDGEAKSQRLRHVIIDALPTIATYQDTGKGFGEQPAETAPAAAPQTPPQRRMKITAVGDETLTIDGKTYPCKVTTFGSPVEEVTYWICPTAQVPYYEMAAEGPDLAVPPRTLKVQYVTRFGTEKVTNVLQVITFKAPLTIGDRTIDCVQLRLTGAGAMHRLPVAASGYTWLSAQVPGTIVKRTLSLTRGPTKIEFTREVETFETK